ncbi:hypothetical protein PUN28_020621 [Cardiocondyla obscurior]|uniref:Uncharacterized protein n=1 Tax=Cardiocondyla obscurior TaxID=286306 RepID=A0AAW2E6N6_9HYME
MLEIESFFFLFLLPLFFFIILLKLLTIILVRLYDYYRWPDRDRHCRDYHTIGNLPNYCDHHAVRNVTDYLYHDYHAIDHVEWCVKFSIVIEKKIKMYKIVTVHPAMHRSGHDIGQPPDTTPSGGDSGRGAPQTLYF